MRAINQRDPKLRAMYGQAVRRATARTVFYRHVAAFISGNILMAVIYFATLLMPGYPRFPWLIWPALGWSIILILHFAIAYYCPDISELRSKHYRRIDETMVELVERSK